MNNIDSISNHKAITVLVQAISYLSCACCLQAVSVSILICLRLGVCSMNSTRQYVLSHGQSALSHGLNQNILTVLKETVASKLELKWLISQNGLQMETESLVGYHIAGNTSLQIRMWKCFQALYKPTYWCGKLWYCIYDPELESNADNT